MEEASSTEVEEKRTEDRKSPENIFGGSRWLTHGEQNHRQKLKEEVESLWQKAERSTSAVLLAQTMQVLVCAEFTNWVLCCDCHACSGGQSRSLETKAVPCCGALVFLYLFACCRHMLSLLRGSPAVLHHGRDAPFSGQMVRSRLYFIARSCGSQPLKQNMFMLDRKYRRVLVFVRPFCRWLFARRHAGF